MITLLQLTVLLRLVCRGGWDTEGVAVMANDTNNSTITCHSYRLAAFTVLSGSSRGSGDQYKVCAKMNLCMLPYS